MKLSDYIPSFEEALKYETGGSALSRQSIDAAFFQSLTKTQSFLEASKNGDAVKITIMKGGGERAAAKLAALAEKDARPGISETEYRDFLNELDGAILYYGEDSNSNVHIVFDNKMDAARRDDLQSFARAVLNSRGIRYYEVDMTTGFDRSWRWTA